jgi:hypothetical protein
VRTLLGGELTQAQSFDSDYSVKLEVQNGSGTWIDVGAALGKAWIVNASGGETVDTPVAEATFTLVQQIGSASLSPLMAGSALNVDDAAAYSPLLNIGRLVRASTATMAHGAALDVAKYRQVFSGRIDAVEQTDAPRAVMAITIRCSDLGAWLMDTQIEVEGRQYGSAAGVPIGTVLQRIVDDNPDGSGIPVTLYDQSTNAFNVTDLAVGRVKVLEALRTTALDATGDDVRFRYDSAHVSRLTRINPDRSRATVDATFSANSYVLRQLDLSIANIRNAGKLPYTDAAGAPQQVTATDAASILKYRRRYFELASTPNITTALEANTLLGTVINDLSVPPGEAAAEIPYCWFVQLYDRYTFSANNRQYDSDQTFAVLGYQWSIENGRGSTTLTLAARVVGAYNEWQRRISTLPSVTPAILNFHFTETETTRTYTGTVVQGVDRVWVYERLVTAGASDLFPADGEPPSYVVTPDTLGAIGVTVQKPAQGKQLGLMFEPRTVTGATGDVRKSIVEAVPSALAGTIKAVVTNDTADLTLSIAGAASSWPVTVHVYEDNPLGAPIYQTTVSAATTIVGPADLTARALPQREVRRWFLKLTDVAGIESWSSTSADRDALPSGTVTPSDYKVAPSLACAYDDDTDAIRVTVPSGKTKTFSGLSGGGVATYTVGDALDDASFESVMARGETRGVYLVEYLGGGDYLTMFTGPLHGQTAAGPSLEVTQTRGSTTDSLAYTAPTGTVELSINGGAFSTAPASPIVVTRPAAGAASLTYTFRLTIEGQTVTESVDVLAIDADTNTVTPDLTAPQSVPTTTTTAFTPVTSNPSGGTAPSLFVTLRGTTGSGSVSGALADGVETAITSGEVITANRPAFGTTVQASADFRSVIGSGGTARIVRTILNQVKTTFGPSLDVVATPGSSSYSLAYTGSGGTVELSISGGSYSTAPASPIVVTRPSAGSTPLDYTFRIAADGQTVTDSVTIPAIDQDTNTVTPDLAVTPSSPTATTQAFTPTASNPSGGTAPSLFVTLRGTTGSGATSGALADGVEHTLVSGEVVTVNRPAFGTSAQASVSFRATIGSNGTETVQRTILNQVRVDFGPSLVVTPTPSGASYSIAYSGTYDTLLLSIDGGTYSAPAASPIIVSRGAADKTYTFKATRDSLDVTVPVTIPAALPPTAVIDTIYQSAVNYTTNEITIGWTFTGTLGSGAFDLLRVKTVGSSPDLSGTPTNLGTTTGSSPRTMIDTVSEDIISTTGPKYTYSYLVRVLDQFGTVVRTSTWLSLTFSTF